MSNILITGATGNIGIEVVKYLNNSSESIDIILAVRNIEKAKIFFKQYSNLDFVKFDFENPETFDEALKSIDRIFLLRPPHISNVEIVFKPLIESIKRNKINEIVFLSVQGVDKSKIIPHHKIEALLKTYDFDYIFLRPSYFMQNLSTTLISDIQKKRAIILPAGNAKFNWVDVENIAELTTISLLNFKELKNKAYEITGLENENFESVTAQINKSIKNPIHYINLNPISFFRLKKLEGMKTGLILVMIILHFLPRFQKEPRISEFYKQITGKDPTDLKTFIEREKIKFDIK